MEEQILNEMRETCKKHMPEIASGLVMEQLEKGNYAINEVVTLKDEILELTESISGYKLEVSEYKKLLSNHADIDSRRTQLKIESDKLKEEKISSELEKVKHELVCQKEITTTIEKFTDKICGHPATTIARSKDALADGGTYPSGYLNNDGSQVMQESPQTTQTLIETSTTTEHKE